MINLKLIYKIIGSLLFIEAMMLLVCLGVSVYYHEDDLLAFASSIAISAGTGLILRLFARNCDNNLSRRDCTRSPMPSSRRCPDSPPPEPPL